MKWPPSPAKRVPWDEVWAYQLPASSGPALTRVAHDLRSAAAAPGVVERGQDRREAAVEADHEPVVAGLSDRVPDRGQLLAP